jgi:excinuclease ABC subunit B
LIAKLTKEMKQAAKNMEFEKAAELRDKIKELNKILLEMGELFYS